jgi:lysophospholipase L1-like esterase
VFVESPDDCRKGFQAYVTDAVCARVNQSKTKMKSRFLFPLTLPVIVLSLLAASVRVDAATLRILPVGDSITLGSGTPGGYRAPLYQLLTNAGYSVDFLGTQTANGAASLPDPDHAGYGGYRIDEIDSIILSTLDAVAEPDVILLLIGTNDYGEGYDTANATNRLEALIAKMATNRPNSRIIVANLLVRNEPFNSQIQTNFNPFVPGICDRQRSMGRKVYFNDLRNAITAADLADSVHPNQLGYNKLATNWFAAVNALLCPSCPATFPLIPASGTWRYLDNGTDPERNRPGCRVAPDKFQ